MSLRGRTRKAQCRQIQLIERYIDYPDRIILGDIIIHAARNPMPEQMGMPTAKAGERNAIKMPLTVGASAIICVPYILLLRARRSPQPSWLTCRKDFDYAARARDPRRRR